MYVHLLPDHNTQPTTTKTHKLPADNGSNQPSNSGSNNGQINAPYSPPMPQPSPYKFNANQNSYISPLAGLQKLDKTDDKKSQKTSIASALFSGWGSSSAQNTNKTNYRRKYSQPTQPNVAAASYSSLNRYKNNPSTFSMTNRKYNDPYSSSTSSIQYSLPSITSQQPLNNVIPPSHPMAVSVTSTPPLMSSSLYSLNSAQNYNGSYNYNKRNGSHQVKFTPKYKKKARSYESDNESNHSQQSDRNCPLVLPSHSVSNQIEDEPDPPQRNKYGVNLQNIAESAEVDHVENTSTLAELVGSKELDALQMSDNNGGLNKKRRNQERYTPPPRSPMAHFEYMKPTVNESEYENDIVKPHAGYSQGVANNNIRNSRVQPIESTTDYVNANDEMADAASTKNTMVSLLTGGDEYGGSIDDNENALARPMRPRGNSTHSRNHLVPIQNHNDNTVALPHLRDGDDDQDSHDNETNEVNLIYSTDDDMNAANTITNVYGDITKKTKLDSFGMFLTFLRCFVRVELSLHRYCKYQIHGVLLVIMKRLIYGYKVQKVIKINMVNVVDLVR